MSLSRLRQSIDDASLALLNQVDRDSYSRLRGCCDRRFWGWKLVDFPDATLQRMVQPLAWMTRRPGVLPVPESGLVGTIVDALLFMESIQHRDGSFDQAYPHEHSVAGTAFLLESASAAMTVVEPACGAAERAAIHRTLERAALFLCRRDETHGVIANHIAGSVLALLRTGTLLGRDDFRRRADWLLDRLLESQSPEGWFPEYGGCDPGYLSLCVYYLAQARPLGIDDRLKAPLHRAVTFLSHFVHPDGTFGGIYGSRRTSVCYPGGIALLARELPIAARMTRFMLEAADARRLLGPGHPDVGNAVPVLVNYQLALDAESQSQDSDDARLPCEAGTLADFPQAGLFIRSSSGVWAIVGASNGGTVSAWDRTTRRRIHDDGGWVGSEPSGRRWTTQSTRPSQDVRADSTSVLVHSRFHRMQQRVPSVLPMIVLRIAGVVLAWPPLGERVKRLLVRLLLTTAQGADAGLDRTVTLTDAGMSVVDVLSGDRRFWKSLALLECGRPFSAIHMASAGYVIADQPVPKITRGDLAVLASAGTYNVTSMPTAAPTHDLPT
jgi:hypothetical protein